MTLDMTFEHREEIIRKEVFEEGMMAGKAEGKAEAIMELLDEIGTVPIDLREKILSTKNMDVLSVWHKAAARSSSMDEFLKRVEQIL